MRRWLARAYLEVDPRSLAAGRIALALVLLFDLARRAGDLDLFYTNEGLLPNHTLLWRPTHAPAFSFFFMASTRLEAIVGFAFCAAAYLALLVGWRTRLAQVASWIAVLSLHGRTLFVHNGGDVVLGEIALWTMFLPTGRRFSVDRLLARLRERDGAPEGAEDCSVAPVVSLAFLALRLQFAAIYLLNAVHKSGGDWLEGSVFHYVLHQDRIVTALGLWVREGLLPIQSMILTWGAVGIEALLGVLLLVPFVWALPARGVIVLATALHVGFGLFLNLGVFVPAMLAWLPNLIPARDWDALAGRASRRLSDGLLERTLVLDRALVSRGIVRERERRPDRPARSVFRRAASWIAPIAVVPPMILAAGQLCVENEALRGVCPAQPRWMGNAVSYFQLWQGWSMFAPGAPHHDLALAVSAKTVDGREVDPFAEVAGSASPVAGEPVPPRLGLDALLCEYSARIPGRLDYHQAFVEWVLRHPERTGRGEDIIVAFEATTVEDESPPMGESRPREPRSRVFLRWP